MVFRDLRRILCRPKIHQCELVKCINKYTKRSVHTVLIVRTGIKRKPDNRHIQKIPNTESLARYSLAVNERCITLPDYRPVCDIAIVQQARACSPTCRDCRYTSAYLLQPNQRSTHTENRLIMREP